MNIKTVGSLLLLFNCIFGGEMIIDSPKQITPEWEEKVFGIKYNITTLDKAVSEMISDKIDGVFDSAFIQRIKSEINKQPSGEYVEYWPNGKIKARLPYKNRKAHGHIHGWHQNGRDAFKGYFKNGLKQGIHLTFYPIDRRDSLNIARILTYDQNGVLNGRQTLCHLNGSLWVNSTYKDGLLNGPLQGWNINDEHFLSSLYKNGLLQKELPKNGPPPERADMRYVNEVTREFIDIAEKEFGLRACGTGASMPFDVERIGVDFTVKKTGSVKESRKIIIELTEKLASIINKHEKIRPYLREFPFPPNRTDITIQFCDKHGLRNTDGSICRAAVGAANTIHYRTQKKNCQSQVFFKEPYEEAVKIVHGEKDSP